MPHSYATPQAFKAAVENRLRAEAKLLGVDMQRRRQLLVFDRFLARLFQTFGNAVVLKGGLVLELRLERARTTKDVDLCMRGNPNEVLGRLQEAGRLDLHDYLKFEVQPDPRHPEIEADGMTYQGLRYRAEARLAAKIYGAPFGVDIAFAEPMHDSPEEVEGSHFLSFAGIAPGRFRIYPLETHIAEKLHAYTLPRKRPNSRVKDLPDLALLATARRIDSSALREALERTFEHRATHPLPAAVPPAPEHWEPVYARLAANDELPWRDLDEVTSAVRRFLDPVLAGSPGEWVPQDWAWEPGEVRG